MLDIILVVSIRVTSVDFILFMIRLRSVDFWTIIAISDSCARKQFEERTEIYILMLLFFFYNF